MDDAIWTTADLRRGGVDGDEIVRRVRARELTRLMRGTFAQIVPDDPRDRHLQLVCAVASGLGANAVLSHQSAAALHGLPVPSTGLERVAVTRPGRGGGHVRNHVHVRRLPLEAEDVTEVDGFQVTSLARTAYDLARDRGLDFGVGVVDAAERLGVTPEEWDRCIDAGYRRPGSASAQFAIAFRDKRAESPGESLGRLRFHQVGIPAPELQYRVMDGHRLVARCDYRWPGLRLVSEFDGLIKYGRLLLDGTSIEEVILAEKAREDDIRAQGWWVHRFCWSDLRHPKAFKAAWDRAATVAARLGPTLSGDSTD